VPPWRGHVSAANLVNNSEKVAGFSKIICTFAAIFLKTRSV
jgi:hypothetical protein